jgi:chain length determinant protein EpsF
MNFSQFLLILRAHWRIGIFTLLVTLTGTAIISKLLPKSYKASVSVVLNYKGVDPVTGSTLPAQLLPGYMATQVDIITSSSVAMMVIDDLKLDQNESIKDAFNKDNAGKNTNLRDWLAGGLQKGLVAEPSKESSVLTIGFKAPNADYAATVANSYASAYLKKSIELRVEPLKKAALFFNEQTKVLRKEFDDAQKKLSLYQQQNGLVSVDKRLDVETTRLNDLASQLVQAQSSAAEATSRQAMVQGEHADESPDVAGNPLIQNLKIGLGNAESKFSELSQRLDKNHPQYLGVKAEMEKLRSQMKEQLVLVSNSVSNNARILQQRELDIRNALAAQKVKVLELNRTRDQLSLLEKEVERAQRAYDTTSQRFMQTNLEGQSNQSDIAVLTPAVPPQEAASPKVVLNMIFSLVVGTMLAVGFALLAEMLDRRVRSELDLERILEVPVLGEMNWRTTGKRRWFKWLRRGRKAKK